MSNTTSRIQRIRSRITILQVHVDNIRECLDADNDMSTLNRTRLRNEIINHQQRIIQWHKLLFNIQKNIISRLQNKH